MNKNEEMVWFRPSRKHRPPVENCPQPETEYRPVVNGPPSWATGRDNTAKSGPDNMRDALYRISTMTDLDAIHEMAGRALTYDRKLGHENENG